MHDSRHISTPTRQIHQVLTLLLLTALGGSAAVSCTKDVPGHSSTSPVIDFTSTTVTKALVQDISDIHEFNIWGCAYGNTSTPSTAVFDQVRVTSGGTDNSWTYNGIRYWKAGMTYDFFGLYPTAAGASLNLETREFTITGYNALSISDPDGTQSDLLLASATGLTYDPATQPDGPGAVQLTFTHLLVKISVAVRTEGLGEGTVSLTDLQLLGPEPVGTYTSDGGWSEIPDQGNDIIKEYSPVQPDGTDLTDKGETFIDDLLLIPTEHPSAYQVRISYTENGTSPGKDITVAIPSIPFWKPGESYLYTLTIKGDYIGFDRPLADDWDDADGGIIIVD